MSQHIISGGLILPPCDALSSDVSTPSEAAVEVDEGSSPSTVGEVVPVLGAVDVALGSGGPEDGPHVLHLPLGVGARGPGKRPSDQHRVREPGWGYRQLNGRQNGL